MIDAKTTLNQLTQSKNGAARLNIMVGGKHFTRNDDRVSFRFTAKAENKANFCKITLNAMDTYDVEFAYVRGMNYTVRSVTEGLYNDMLKGHFEEETKLYLSL